MAAFVVVALGEALRSVPRSPDARVGRIASSGLENVWRGCSTGGAVGTEAARRRTDETATGQPP